MHYLYLLASCCAKEQQTACSHLIIPLCTDETIPYATYSPQLLVTSVMLYFHKLIFKYSVWLTSYHAFFLCVLFHLMNWHSLFIFGNNWILHIVTREIYSLHIYLFNIYGSIPGIFWLVFQKMLGHLITFWFSFTSYTQTRIRYVDSCIFYEETWDCFLQNLSNFSPSNSVNVPFLHGWYCLLSFVYFVIEILSE